VARCVCNKFFSCYGIIPHLLRIFGGRNANDRHVLHRHSAFSLRAPCQLARLSHQHPASGAAQSNSWPHLGQSFCTGQTTTPRTDRGRDARGDCRNWETKVTPCCPLSVIRFTPNRIRLSPGRSTHRWCEGEHERQGMLRRDDVCCVLQEMRNPRYVAVGSRGRETQSPDYLVRSPWISRRGAQCHALGSLHFAARGERNGPTASPGKGGRTHLVDRELKRCALRRYGAQTNDQWCQGGGHGRKEHW